MVALVASSLVVLLIAGGVIWPTRSGGRSAPR